MVAPPPPANCWHVAGAPSMAVMSADEKQAQRFELKVGFPNPSVKPESGPYLTQQS
jgi:hypothetical protein